MIVLYYNCIIFYRVLAYKHRHKSIPIALVLTLTPERASTDDLSVTPDKIGIVKEMFPQRSNDEVMVLLSLLNGSLHKVISSVCLKGLTPSVILHVFKSSRELTRVRKVFIDPDNILRDALCLYMSPNFDISKPIEVDLIGLEAI